MADAPDPSTTATVRAFESSDLSGAATLFLRQLGGPGLVTIADARDFLQRTLLDDPWADPEIPSLVSQAPDGRIVGFIGASVRRIRVDGAPRRAAYASHLVAAPDYPNRTIGLFLLRAFLRGAQDVSLSDTATPQVRTIWTTLGGVPIHHLSTAWLRVLRPTATASAVVRHRGGRMETVARGLDLVRPLTDRVARKLVPDPSLATDSLLEGTELTPALAVESLESLTAGCRVIPNYDEGYLTWLYRALRTPSPRGRVELRLVRARGAAIGMYAYYLQPGDVCRVLQVVCRERHAEAVIGDLHRHAYERGGAALYGRIEPHIHEAIARRGALVRTAPRALVHTRDEACIDALQHGRSSLSWLDGEWW